MEWVGYRTVHQATKRFMWPTTHDTQWHTAARRTLVDRVRGGETVLVGGALRVNLEGIACLKPKFSLPWRSCGGAKVHNGAVWIYQAGVDKPLTAAALSNPNAGLIPPLFAALTS